MKKIVLGLCAALALSLTACGEKEDKNNYATSPNGCWNNGTYSGYQSGCTGYNPQYQNYYQPQYWQPYNYTSYPNTNGCGPGTYVVWSAYGPTCYNYAQTGYTQFQYYYYYGVNYMTQCWPENPCNSGYSCSGQVGVCGY